ncbi:MFS transporter [Ectobacillus ponti]|uniref:MFS transporter n=1 Tax=Ectobacillus ponti TaxID=2961894 RepID=A0AA41X367_9BACI|nr:MFS transporter [Ectobacillus ponti]MCP8967772.1 MFS transporter [Ectobacillus ponti]
MQAARFLPSPVRLLHWSGIADGISLLVLLGIAMPLKYMAGYPLAVTIAGSVHGGIFILYALAIVYAQARLQWHIKWSFFAGLVAFIPFGNFVYDRILKKHQHAFTVKPIPQRWLIYAIVLFTFIDLFTQLPVMSTFATSVGATVMVAGFIVGMYSLTNTFGNVLSGILTDRYGAFIVLSAGLLTTSLALSSYALVTNVAGLMLVRFIHGFFGGLIVPAAFTYLANETRDDQQGSQNALTGFFVGIAAIIGPAYSGIMASRTSVPFVFLTVAGFGLLLFLLTMFGLQKRRTAAVKESRNQGLVLNKGVLQAFAGAFFLMFSQGALAYLLPLHVAELGYSPRLSGTLLSTFGLVAVLLFALPTNRLFDRLSPLASFAIGLGSMGISQILIGQAVQEGLLYACLAFYGVGFAFLFPAINLLLIGATTLETRGKAYGYFYAFFSVGVVAGSSGLGLLTVPLPMQFLVTGIILLSCVGAVFFLNKQQAVKQESQYQR